MQNTDSTPQGPIQLGLNSPTVLSVREFVLGIRDLVEYHFGDVWVEGEISNFKKYNSGHCYFTLKDSSAQIHCVMWKHFTRFVFFEPRDGMLVRVHGTTTVYEQRGDLQLVIKSMRLAGEGELQKAFEELKHRLMAEGLFDQNRKRSIPAFPECIGIITSADGAVLHDILSIIGRRFPQVGIIVCPVRVQGIGSAESVVRAITVLNNLDSQDPRCPDLIILARGGGSLEDLWTFNEEPVVRAIFASHIPVVSAIGHETDFTIADFVADVRASTPSMAAELVTPNRQDVTNYIANIHFNLRNKLRDRIDQKRRLIKSLTESYRFNRPIERLRRNQQHLDELSSRLIRSIGSKMRAESNRLDGVQHRLELLDPRRPLQLGYARVERNGEPVKRASLLQREDIVALRFIDGQNAAKII